MVIAPLALSVVLINPMTKYIKPNIGAALRWGGNLLFAIWLSACGELDEHSKLQKLAEAGNASAQHNLALRLTSGEEKTRNYPLAVEWYKKAAAQGMVESAFNLGVIYKSGANGVPKAMGEACRWFQHAAERGLPNGFFQFGLCLGDTKESADWLRKAAEAGVADAAANLGIRIMYGHGVPQDIRLGVEWEKRAAEMGSPMGMYNYAVFLEQGIGVVKNERSAFEWHSKAVAADYCSAYRALAFYYRYGVVVPKDEKRALELIYNGANRGSKAALESLAKIFEKGELGQAKDPAKAASVRSVAPTCGIESR